LPNGAVQENWVVVGVFDGGTLDGRQRLVPKNSPSSAPSTVPD
jgi:hypothetical protein